MEPLPSSLPVRFPRLSIPRTKIYRPQRPHTNFFCVFQALSAVATWFHHKRGLAFGITMSGSSTGGVIFPIMLNQLIPKVGYGWAMRISAFLILAMLIVANLTVKSRTPPAKQPAMTIKEFFSPLAEMPFLLTALGNFLFIFGLFIPIDYIIVQAIHEGMSTRLANYLVPILNAARFVIFPS